jgi:hypothetical protein
MLPTRKSSPAPRRNHAVAAEVRVPELGLAFGALAASIRPEGLYLTTFQELKVGTVVMVELSLPDGPMLVDGVVVRSEDPSGLGLAIELEGVDAGMRIRLGAASSILPPAPESKVA